MTYFVSEDTKISEKLIQLISRSMDIMDQSANQPTSQLISLSALDRQTDFSQPVSLTYRFRRYKNIMKMDSTYITENAYNGPVSQPVSQSGCLCLTDRLTSASQSVYPSIDDRQTDFINDLYRFRKYKYIRRIDSTYIAEYGYNGPVSQPANQSASQSVCP